MVDQLYIIDGHSVMHRSYHSPMRPLSGPEGSCEYCEGGECRDGICEVCKGTSREPTTVVHQFLEMLKHVALRRKPAYLAVCMDTNRNKLKRRALSPSYKAGRGDTKDDLRAQIRRVKQIVQLLGVSCYQLEGYEADDIIATVAKRYAGDTLQVRIVSKDKDMGTLLADPRILMYDQTDNVDIGPEWIRKRFGVEPCQMNDYLTLVGDTTDGIKGVSGVGEKTAAKWLQEYGSIKAMLYSDHFRYQADASAINRKFWTAVSDGTLDLARALVKLDHRVPIDFKLCDLEFTGLDFRSAAPVLRALGFRQWSKNGDDE